MDKNFAYGLIYFFLFGQTPLGLVGWVLLRNQKRPGREVRTMGIALLIVPCYLLVALVLKKFELLPGFMVGLGGILFALGWVFSLVTLLEGLNPPRADRFLKNGLAAWRAGRLTEAMRRFNLGLERFPEDFRLLGNRSSLYLFAGMPQEARRDLEMGLKDPRIKPQEAWHLRAQLVNCFRQLGYFQRP